jgi:hypothetical protein
MAGAITGNVIPAPGAMVSPQAPGMTPNRTTIPTHVDEPIPPAVVKVRPLTQYETAEEMLGVFKSKPMAQLEPADFEQAPASPEEMRKALPAELAPIRPLAPLEHNIAVDAGPTTPELESGAI